MTIDEAIDILSYAPRWDKKSNDAIRIAIEVLKLVNDSQGLVKDDGKDINVSTKVSKGSDELDKNSVLISKKDLLVLLKRIEDMRPYKVSGDWSTYSDYNEGWQDAVMQVDANLNLLPKIEVSKFSEELVKIYKHLWFFIGETLVAESKCHMSPEKALDKIRTLMQQADIERAKWEVEHEKA